MDKATYQNLINAISKFYLNDKSGKNLIREIIANKIDQIDQPSVFKSLCNDFNDIGKVEDFSFLQFPNLKLVLEDIETVGDYHRNYKNFAVCISLLCPYYSFYYEYEFKIKTIDGFMRISNICFLNDPKFSLIRKDINLNKINSLIKSHYPDHSYVDHYSLLINNVTKGLPFGEVLDEESEYSIFRYLFDNVKFDQYFQ